FSPAVAEFVDGFASEGRVPPFGYLLHWMDLLQNQRKLAAPAIRQLHRIFYDTGGNWRNAGALAATLSRTLPEVPQPRSLARVLAALLERPRLAGAQTYVPQLVGALTLPPRRLTPQELPIGGYTDIVTRGQVEHLLPAQFALDEMEFLRRFAEKELLYY